LKATEINKNSIYCNDKFILFQRRESTQYVYFRLRGNIFRKLGKLDDAKDDIRHALELHPDAHGCWLDMGKISFDAKSYAEVKNCMYFAQSRITVIASRIEVKGLFVLLIVLGKIDKKRLTNEDSQRMETLLHKMDLLEKGIEIENDQSINAAEEEIDKQQSVKMTEETNEKDQILKLTENGNEEQKI